MESPELTRGGVQQVDQLCFRETDQTVVTNRRSGRVAVQIDKLLVPYQVPQPGEETRRNAAVAVVGQEDFPARFCKIHMSLHKPL